MTWLLFFVSSAGLALAGLWAAEPYAVPPVLGTTVLILALAVLYAALTE